MDDLVNLKFMTRMSLKSSFHSLGGDEESEFVRETHAVCWSGDLLNDTDEGSYIPFFGIADNKAGILDLPVWCD